MKYLAFAAALAVATAAQAQIIFQPAPLDPNYGSTPCGSNVGQTTTWNPSDKNASITLSNSNYTASFVGAGSNVSVRATSSSRHSGKRYFLVHVDTSPGTTGWVAGGANASMLLSHYPGGQDKNSVGGYVGNWVTQGGGAGDGPQGYNAASPSAYSVVVLDMDDNTGWVGVADASCVANDSQWSGPTTLTGNPGTNTDGINIADVNDGSSIMPAWGGFASSGTSTATVYTNTNVISTKLSGFKRWDAP